MLDKMKKCIKSEKRAIAVGVITGLMLLIIEENIFPLISKVMNFKVPIKLILIFMAIICILILRKNNLNKSITSDILRYRKDEYKGNLFTWDYEKRIENYTISGLKHICSVCESEVEIHDEVEGIYVLGCNGNYYEISADDYNLYLKSVEDKIYENILLKVKNKNYKSNYINYKSTCIK